MNTMTPEAFLALPPDAEDEGHEDEMFTPAATDPSLASIAESLAKMLGLLEAKAGEVDEHNDLVDHLRSSGEAYDDLDAKYADLYALVEEIETIIKPSTSKLANTVRGAIGRWKNPATIDLTTVIEDEGSASDEPEIAGEHPALDAPVEDWRAYARAQGYRGDDVDSMNRSQIRSMLDIEQPVAVSES